MKRRAIFATPFVLVVGCKRPVESRPFTPDEVGDETLVGNVSPDAAAPDAPLPPDGAPIDVADSVARERACEPVGRALCNPPLPKDYRFRMSGYRAYCNVTRARVEGRDTMLELDHGTDAGIQSGWLGDVLDTAGARTGSCVVAGVSAQTATCKAATDATSKVRVVLRAPTSTDAGTVDAPIDAKRPTSPDTRVNPPRPMIGRVVRREVQGPALILVFDRGSTHGVRREWSAVSIDDEERPVKNGACVIIRVEKSTTVCKSNLTTDQIDRNLRIRIGP